MITDRLGKVSRSENSHHYVTIMSQCVYRKKKMTNFHQLTLVSRLAKFDGHGAAH